MDAPPKPCPVHELIEELDVLQRLLPGFLELDRGGTEVGLEVVAARYKMLAARSWRYFSESEAAGFANRMALRMAVRNSGKAVEVMARYEETFERLRNSPDQARPAQDGELADLVQTFRSTCQSTDEYFRSVLGQRVRAAA
jgi:hypothetical protein